MVNDPMHMHKIYTIYITKILYQTLILLNSVYGNYYPAHNFFYIPTLFVEGVFKELKQNSNNKNKKLNFSRSFRFFVKNSF